MKPFIITLGGDSVSGKTTAAKKLVETFDIPYINMGKLQRDMAKEMSFKTVEEWDAYVQKHPEIDKELDAMLIERAKSEEKALLEGRLAGWMCHINDIPSFKIWLTASKEVRTERLAQRDHVSLDEAKQRIDRRDVELVQRFKDVYDIDISDLSIYNLVISTDEKSPEEVYIEIMTNIREYFPDHEIWQKQ